MRESQEDLYRRIRLRQKATRTISKLFFFFAFVALLLGSLYGLALSSQEVTLSILWERTISNTFTIILFAIFVMSVSVVLYGFGVLKFKYQENRVLRLIFRSLSSGEGSIASAGGGGFGDGIS